MVVLIIFLILMLVFLCLVLKINMINSNKFCGYVIVLGASILVENTPCKTLECRLMLAIEYLNKFSESKVIVTGGQGVDEVVSEASVMKKYLVEHGINSDRILVEDKSTSTFENLNNSKKFIKDTEEIMIISSRYHLFRAKMLAFRVGFKKVNLIGSKNRSRFWKVDILREIFAIAKSFFIDW